MEAFLKQQGIKDGALRTVAESASRLGYLMDLPVTATARQWCDPVSWTLGQNGQPVAQLCREYETRLGIPALLGALEFQICQGLPLKEAKAFPAAFLTAIQPGADLSNVWSSFAAWRLDDPEAGVIRFVTDDNVAELLRLTATLCRFEGVEVDAWQSLRSDVQARHDESHAIYGLLDIIDIQLAPRQTIMKVTNFVERTVSLAEWVKAAPYATARAAEAVRVETRANEYKLMHDALFELLQAAA